MLMDLVKYKTRCNYYRNSYRLKVGEVVKKFNYKIINKNSLNKIFFFKFQSVFNKILRSRLL